MNIIGTLLKNALQVSQLINQSKSPRQAQIEQLKKLLSNAADTAFGKYYGFSRILESKEVMEVYKHEVPIHHYSDMSPWWHQQQKYPDITWPGMPDYYALSSGTTGKKSKKIPVTDEMLRSFRMVSLSQISSLSNFNLPPDLFTKQLLAISSSSNLSIHRNHLEGEISGINVSNVPDWFDYFYKPGGSIAQIDDWDNRLKAIVQAAPHWDIGALAGIPSWVLLVLKAIKERYQLNHIHEIWPNLKIYTTGGVAFESYKSSFDALFDQPVIYMDTYLASEGYFAFNARPDTSAMELALQHGIYFEFIPFNDQGFNKTGQLIDTPKTVTIDEVELDKEYALLISTPAGAYRYLIGDLIKFTNLTPHEIRITGRTKYFINVVGSQLSEEKLNSAVQQLSKLLDCKINEFTVAALQNSNGDYYHQWILGSEQSIDTENCTAILDQLLQEMNKNYRVARNKALKYISVLQVNKSDFYDWLETTKKKGGQIKVPKVMSEHNMKDFLRFLDV